MKPEPQAILRALFDRNGGPVFVVDSEFRYVEFNDEHRTAMRTLYGRDPVPGVCLPDLIPDPASRAMARRNLETALAGETVVEETPYDEQSPPVVCYRVSHNPVKGPGGPITGVLVVALDITAEKEATRRLNLQRRHLDEAMDASEIASWSYNGDTGETSFSDRYYTMLGYSPGSFPQSLETWVSLLHPDERDATVASFRYHIQSKSDTFRMEFRLRTKSGGWKWILGQAKVVGRDSRGLPTRVAGTNQDITARKLAEAALKESESRWTSLVDMAPVGISLIGAGGIIQFVNRKESLFKDPGVLGRNWKEFMPEELHPELDRVLEEGFQKGESIRFRSWSKDADGGVAYYENHTSPILEDGGVSALLVVSIDVTSAELVTRRRKKAERRMEILLALHDQTKGDRQRLFDQALNSAVELTDSAIGYIYFYSEETETFTLHSWSRGVMDACRVMDPQTTYSLAQTGYWGEAVRQRRPIVVNDFAQPTEFHRGMPAGHVAIQRFLTIPVWEAGQIVAVVGVGNKHQPYDGDDVDELTLLADNLWQLVRRQESEQALQRLYQAIEHAPVSVVITDKTGAITFANTRFLTLTGYPAKEVLGANPRILNSGQMEPRVYQELWETILAGNEWQGELVNKKKDGTLFTELASISPVLDPGGEITHFIAVKEDITERKRTQELLVQTQKMETIGQLAAGVAHDFNNMLTSMLGYNQMLLLKLAPDSPLRIYAEKTALSGSNAASLISGLLAVGRRQRMEPLAVDLEDLLNDERALVASLVKAPLRLVWDLGPGPLPVLVDPGQISQVLVNLVSNAKDALDGPGQITVRTGSRRDSQGSWVWFSVEDDGPGIPVPLRNKIFDPFFTTKGIGKGTGLGLSIVQGIIHQHRGTIVLDPTPVTGARFVVSLPWAATEVADQAPVDES